MLKSIRHLLDLLKYDFYKTFQSQRVFLFWKNYFESPESLFTPSEGNRSIADWNSFCFRRRLQGCPFYILPLLCLLLKLIECLLTGLSTGYFHLPPIHLQTAFRPVVIMITSCLHYTTHPIVVNLFSLLFV